MKVKSEIDPVALKKYRDKYFSDLEKDPFLVGVGNMRPFIPSPLDEENFLKTSKENSSKLDKILK